MCLSCVTSWVPLRLCDFRGPGSGVQLEFPASSPWPFHLRILFDLLNLLFHQRGVLTCEMGNSSDTPLSGGVVAKRRRGAGVKALCIWDAKSQVVSYGFGSQVMTVCMLSFAWLSVACLDGKGSLDQPRVRSLVLPSLVPVPSVWLRADIDFPLVKWKFVRICAPCDLCIFLL